MNSKAKKIGKVLLFASLGFMVLWCVFFALRYVIFQKSVDLGQGLVDHFGAIGKVFGDLHYHDDKLIIYRFHLMKYQSLVQGRSKV